MAGVTILSSKAKTVEDDQKRMMSTMKGEIPCFMSETPNAANLVASGKAFKKEVKDAQQYAKAAYEFAALRDAFYCVVGRKYLRRQAVAGRIISDLRRGSALAQIEIERPASK
jgi:hypothetical protein